MRKDIVSRIENESIYLFRVNLSHTPIESVEDVIREIQSYTNVPVCLDSEGAQIRNQFMINEEVLFSEEDLVKVHFNEVEGNSNNISFSPNYVARQLRVGDEIRIDYDSAHIRIVERSRNYCLAEVVVGGKVGSNKAADLNREIQLEPTTQKDKKAIEIGRKMGIKHFALSFAGSSEDLEMMRELAGREATIISKIESVRGVLNLSGIVNASDEILIDRGDLSRQVEIEKIPFLQRRIVATARSKGVPVYVATNLLESMIKVRVPTRAEINDVVSTLLTGANGLVLAAETAIGNYPVEAVRMIRRLICQFEKWTPNTSIGELIES